MSLSASLAAPAPGDPPDPPLSPARSPSTFSQHVTLGSPSSYASDLPLHAGLSIETRTSSADEPCTPPAAAWRNTRPPSAHPDPPYASPSSAVDSAARPVSRWQRWLSPLSSLPAQLALSMLLLASSVTVAVLFYVFLRSHDLALFRAGFSSSCLAQTASVQRDLDGALSTTHSVTKAVSAGLSPTTGAPIEQAFITEWIGGTLTILATIPSNASLTGLDLLTLVNLSSVLPDPSSLNSSASSPPTAAPALGLPDWSVFLLVPFTNASSSSMLVVSVINLARSLRPLPSVYEMQLQLASTTVQCPDIIVVTGAQSPPLPPPPPPGPPPPGPPPPGPPPPPSSSATLSLDDGEAVSNEFSFLNQGFAVTCTPATSAVSSTRSTSLFTLVIVTPIIITLLTLLLFLGRCASSSRSPSPNLFAYFLDRLNNPLHQILSLLSFLEEGSGGEMDVEILQSIKAQARIMTAIVGHAMEARGGDGEVMRLDWKAMIKDGMVSWRGQAESRRVRVECAVDKDVPVVYGDVRKLAQLVHLIMSSVIAVTSRGTVSLTVKAGKEKEASIKQLNAKLSSTSPSSSPHTRLRRIFHSAAPSLPIVLSVRSPSFLPRDALTALFDSQHSHDGLGFALVSRMVSAMKGKVEVQGGKDGTTFEVCISLAVQPPGSGQLAGSPMGSTGVEGGDEYAVRIRWAEDGVRVENVPVHDKMSGGAAATEGRLGERPGSPPAVRKRRQVAAEHSAHGDTEEEGRDDCKDIEQTTFNAQPTPFTASHALHSTSSADETPLSTFRPTPLSASASALTPSISPSSALSNASSAGTQLYTPSALLGRLHTEIQGNQPSPSTLPMRYPRDGTLAIGASFSHGLPPSALVLPRERRRSGLATEIATMSRQVAAAKIQVRMGGSGVEGAEEAVDQAVLSVEASARRLGDPVALPAPSASASFGAIGPASAAAGGVRISPLQPMGRCASAPESTAGDAAERADEKHAAHGAACTSSSDYAARSSPSSSSASPASCSPTLSSVSAMRSQTSKGVRSEDPSTSPAPLRVLSMPICSTLPAQFCPLTPSSSGLPIEAESSLSSTPPLPRQHSAASRRSLRVDEKMDEKLRMESVRALLASSSVLVVDDSEINLKIALRMLAGIDCHTATDGAQAVDAWKKRAGIGGATEEKATMQGGEASAPSPLLPSSSCSSASCLSSPPFSLILCDVIMPVMSGLDATRAIRSLESVHSLSPIPIIAVTANCTQHDRKAASAAGMDLLLAKPFTVKQLYAVMDLALKGRKGGDRERGKAEPTSTGKAESV